MVYDQTNAVTFDRAQEWVREARLMLCFDQHGHDHVWFWDDGSTTCAGHVNLRQSKHRDRARSEQGGHGVEAASLLGEGREVCSTARPVSRLEESTGHCVRKDVVAIPALEAANCHVSEIWTSAEIVCLHGVELKACSFGVEELPDSFRGWA